MRSQHLRALSAWAVLLLRMQSVHADDSVLSDVFGIRFPGAQYAYGGSLSLKHVTSSGGVVAGFSDTQFPVGSLAVADVDVYRHETEHFYFSAGASLGDANTGSHSDILYKARLSVDAQIDPRWLVRMGDQFIDLNVIHGHLLTGGVQYRPTPKWGIDVSGGYGLSGTLADRYGQLALNWYGTDRLYGGVVIGRTGYDPANLGEVAAIRRLFQVYGGASIPIARGSLTLGFDSLSLDGAPRQTLRIGVVEPFKL